MKIYKLSTYYKDKYGFRVFKVGLSTGIECPKRANSSESCHFCVKNTFIDTGLESHSCNGRIHQSHKSYNITEQINYLIKKLKQKVKAEGFVAYFQDNTSLYGEPALLFSMFSEAAEHPDILELIISTRPDFLPIEILDKLTYLKKPVTIEIGVQSVNDKSLLFLNRGHTQEENQKAIDILMKYSFRIGVHIILGIPGETLKDIDKTITWINENEIINDVKIHHLAVFRGSKLAEIIAQGDIINLEDYIKLLTYFTRKLRKNLTISRLFTSNLNRNQIMLNDFPGDKRMWMNKFIDRS